MLFWVFKYFNCNITSIINYFSSSAMIYYIFSQHGKCKWTSFINQFWQATFNFIFMLVRQQTVRERRAPFHCRDLILGAV